MKVLDASAVLALLNAEPGAETVAEQLATGDAVVSAVNFAEIMGKVFERGVPEPDAAALWRRLTPAFEERGFTLRRLALSGRGSWRAETDRGAVLELGRGSEGEVAERSERVLRTLAQITDRYRAPLLHADLRHQDGYALRLRGVTTAAAAPGKPGTGH